MAERFVLFNDDMFLVGNVSPEIFFKNGLPCTTAVTSPHRVIKGTRFFTPVANVSVLNEHFSARKAILSNLSKWINPKYGIDCLRTVTMLPYPNFYGFKEYHMPNPYLKTMFEQVWGAEHEVLDRTCLNRFRGETDVSQWLIREWQVATGAFNPLSSKVGAYYELGTDFDELLIEACKNVLSGAHPMMCISDSLLGKR